MSILHKNMLKSTLSMHSRAEKKTSLYFLVSEAPKKDNLALFQIIEE